MSGRTDGTAGRPATVAETLLFAPIGLVDTAVRSTPRRVKQLRTDLTAARFLGEMAVTRGLAEWRSRRSPDGDPPAGARTVRPRSTPSAPARETPGPADAEVSPDPETTSEMPVPEVSELPIVDYDAVPAIDVVAQLEHLDSAERSLVERYERANRGRRTVLGKLTQLSEAS